MKEKENVDHEVKVELIREEKLKGAALWREKHDMKIVLCCPL